MQIDALLLKTVHFARKEAFAHAKAMVITMRFPVIITSNAKYFPINTILLVGGMGLILLAAIILYTVLVSRLIPNRALRLRYVERMGDRGIRRYRTEEGHAVVYAPGSRCAPGITQYILFHRSEDGSKAIVCKTNGKIDSIRYDIAVFDGCGQMIDVLEVTDTLSGGRYTKAVVLPQATSYVSVILRQADGRQVCADRVFDSDRVGRIVCAASTVLLTILLTVLMRKLLSGAIGLLDDVYRYKGLTSPHISWPVTILIGGLFGMLLAWILLLRDKRRVQRKMNR